MKKKILSFILVLFMIPTMFVLSACGDKGYQLDKLETDFFSVADECKTIERVDNKFHFTYSNFSYEGTPILQNAINDTKPYIYLKDYNQVFENLMAFVYDYIDECSHSSIEADENFRNALKQEMDDLHASIKVVDGSVQVFAESLVSNPSDIQHETCLARFRNVLIAYDDLFQKSINFSNSLAELYFDYALNDANPNFFNVSVNDFNAGMVINKLNARIKYQISNLTQSYVEMYFDGSNVPNNLTDSASNFGELDLNAFSYQDNVKAINKSFDINSAIEKANNSSNKVNFMNLAIDAYNLQASLKNDANMFIKACNNVSYCEIIKKVDLTAQEKLNVKQINDYNHLLGEYNKTLINMLNIIGV